MIEWYATVSKGIAVSGASRTNQHAAFTWNQCSNPPCSNAPMLLTPCSMLRPQLPSRPHSRWWSLRIIANITKWIGRKCIDWHLDSDSRSPMTFSCVKPSHMISHMTSHMISSLCGSSDWETEQRSMRSVGRIPPVGTGTRWSRSRQERPACRYDWPKCRRSSVLCWTYLLHDGDPVTRAAARTF